MINMANTDEICLRLKYSDRFKDGAECEAALSNMALTQNRRGSASVGKSAAETWIQNSRNHREAARISRMAKDYMMRNLNTRIQMPVLANVTEVSLSRFYSLFKLATGYTPNDFLIRARIHRACQMLRETGLSVKEVATALGYNDPLYFSRAFKLVNGASPREYRALSASSRFPDMSIAAHFKSEIT
jgi:AraC-like DNA-binding protein